MMLEACRRSRPALRTEVAEFRTLYFARRVDVRHDARLTLSAQTAFEPGNSNEFAMGEGVTDEVPRRGVLRKQRCAFIGDYDGYGVEQDRWTSVDLLLCRNEPAVREHGAGDLGRYNLQQRIDILDRSTKSIEEVGVSPIRQQYAEFAPSKRMGAALYDA
jgi:hypothetical protein